MPRDQYTFGHTSEFRREDNGHGTVQKHTVQVRGTVTMAELIAELTNQGAPDEVYVSNASIQWDAEASLDALQNREAMKRAAIERQEMWERQTLANLTKKYEGRELSV